MDWWIGDGLAEGVFGPELVIYWSRIDIGLADWSWIGIGLADWSRIDIELADWSWIDIGLADW